MKYYRTIILIYYYHRILGIIGISCATKTEKKLSVEWYGKMVSTI